MLVQDGGDTIIKFRTLDVSDTKSIEEFASFLKKEHPEGIDFVVNNAGIAMDGFGRYSSSQVIMRDAVLTSNSLTDNNVVKQTLHTNYYGTLTATQLLLPQIRNNGRLVNITSMSGKLNKYTPELRERFLSASQTSVPACSTLMEEFTSAVAAKKEKEQGWPSAAYAVSKAGATAMTKAVAMEESKKERGVLVNACCPGYVNTDMTKGNGSKTVDEGAKTPVMLALGDVQGQTGGFWQSEKILEW